MEFEEPTVERDFSIDEEISLFSCYKENKLAGVHKHFRMIIVLNRFTCINNLKNYTSDDIWRNLKKYFSLADIDAIEDELNEPVVRPFSIKNHKLNSDKFSKGQANKPSDSISFDEIDVNHKNISTSRSKRKSTTRNASSSKRRNR